MSELNVETSDIEEAHFNVMGPSNESDLIITLPTEWVRVDDTAVTFMREFFQVEFNKDGEVTVDFIENDPDQGASSVKDVRPADEEERNRVFARLRENPYEDKSMAWLLAVEGSR